MGRHDVAEVGARPRPARSAAHERTVRHGRGRLSGAELYRVPYAVVQGTVAVPSCPTPSCAPRWSSWTFSWKPLSGLCHRSVRLRVDASVGARECRCGTDSAWTGRGQGGAWEARGRRGHARVGLAAASTSLLAGRDQSWLPTASWASDRRRRGSRAMKAKLRCAFFAASGTQLDAVEQRMIRHCIGC